MKIYLLIQDRDHDGCLKILRGFLSQASAEAAASLLRDADVGGKITIRHQPVEAEQQRSDTEEAVEAVVSSLNRTLHALRKRGMPTQWVFDDALRLGLWWSECRQEFEAGPATAARVKS